jgi:uncharacterized protein
MQKPIERRAVRGLEVRKASKDGFIGTLVGYAAVFNSESEDMCGWKEILLPGCFAKSLRESPDVFAFEQHDSDEVIARTTAGTLRVTEDEKGLAVEIDLIDTQDNKDLLANIRAGHLTSMSFGMYADSIVCTWENRPEYSLRKISECALVEVSIVTFPAYQATEISARSFKQFREETSTVPVSIRMAQLELEKLR